jgi:hypothetical protein
MPSQARTSSEAPLRSPRRRTKAKSIIEVPSPVAAKASVTSDSFRPPFDLRKFAANLHIPQAVV